MFRQLQWKHRQHPIHRHIKLTKFRNKTETTRVPIQTSDRYVTIVESPGHIEIVNHVLRSERHAVVAGRWTISKVFAEASQMRRAFHINYLQHHRGGHKIQDQTLTYCTWRTAQTQAQTSTFIQLIDRTLQNKQSFLLPFVVEIYCLLQILEQALMSGMNVIIIDSSRNRTWLQQTWKYIRMEAKCRYRYRTRSQTQFVMALIQRSRRSLLSLAREVHFLVGIHQLN